MTEGTVSIRIDKDLKEWLEDHHDRRLKSNSAVIRELKEFWEQCQNEK